MITSDLFKARAKIPRISTSKLIDKGEFSSPFYEKNKLSSNRLTLNMSLLSSSDCTDPNQHKSIEKRTSLDYNTLSTSISYRTRLSTTRSTNKKFEINSGLSTTTSMTSRHRWENLKTPATPKEVLERFSDLLPAWEQEEVKLYNEIFYIGKNFKPKEPDFDDENGDYKILIKDHIGFRYEIIGLIGKGSFGQVIEVYDHSQKKSVAVKIIKNKTKFNKQARIEVEILEYIKEFDKNRQSNIIEILDKFIFRNHMVIYI
jgi:Protein kinase domain